jgi:hypothetical protein
MLTNTLTNETKHEYHVGKFNGAWNHAGKIQRLQLQRWICSSSRYEGTWRVAGYSSTHACHQHYMELSCRIHIAAALPRGKRPLETLNTKLGGSQNWCGRFAEENIFRSCWESMYDCFVVQSVDSSVYRLYSPVSRTYIFVFRTMCFNRHEHCPSPSVTRNKIFWSFHKCRVWRDSTCWTVSKTHVLDHPWCGSGWMNFDKNSC